MQKLNNIPPKNPFKVPENYFNEVNKKILSATSETEREVIKLSFYSRFRTRILVAASIAGFIIISYTGVRLLSPGNPVTQISGTIKGISNESIMNDVDISTLEENVSSEMLSEDVPEVNKKDIIDYLLLDNIELNEIYEQL